MIERRNAVLDLAILTVSGLVLLAGIALESWWIALAGLGPVLLLTGPVLIAVVTIKRRERAGRLYWVYPSGDRNVDACLDVVAKTQRRQPAYASTALTLILDWMDVIAVDDGTDEYRAEYEDAQRQAERAVRRLTIRPVRQS